MTAMFYIMTFFISAPLYKVFVLLIALGTSNGVHKEMLVPHHITSNLHAVIFMYLIDYPGFPRLTNTGLSGLNQD